MHGNMSSVEAGLYFKARAEATGGICLDFRQTSCARWGVHRPGEGASLSTHQASIVDSKASRSYMQ